MNAAYVSAILRHCKDVSIRDRCLVTSLLMRENFGGEIAVSMARDARKTHYVNLIMGIIYDFANDHEMKESSLEILPDPELFLRVPRVKTNFDTLRQRWTHAIHQPLALQDVQQVVIQYEEENPGSYLNPDLSSLLLTSSVSERHDMPTFYPGQTIWLKFGGGPIVGRANLTRWVSGSRRYWSDDDIRNACSGYPVAGHKATWAALRECEDEFFLLIFGEDAEILNVPLHPVARSPGRRVVSLDTAAKTIAWLHGADCDLHLDDKSDARAESSRNFRPYHFQWEDSLDIEVTMALDERMPRSGRFFDRVQILNDALLDHFHLLETCQDELIEAFSEDEIVLLAELLEEYGETPSQKYLVAVARSAGEALGLRYEPLGAHLLELAEQLGSLGREEFAILLDELRTTRGQLLPTAPRAQGQTIRAIVRKALQDNDAGDEFREL